MALFDYQEQCVTRVTRCLSVHNRSILVAPTGAGKTKMAIALIKQAIAIGQKVGFYVHRDVLIDQTKRELLKEGIRSGSVAGGRSENRGSLVQVVSCQSATVRDLEWFDPALTVADECHITLYSAALAHFQDKSKPGLVGLTGTPWRLSKKESLGDIFPRSSLVLAPPPSELIERGFLVPPVYYGVPFQRSGRLYCPIEYAINQYKRIAYGRLAIAFCQSVEQARQVAEVANLSGINAASVSGRDSKTKCDRIYAEFAKGDIQLLASCGKLGEGFDVPHASVLIDLAVTKSRAKYWQKIGRVLRVVRDPQIIAQWGNKTDAIVLDGSNGRKRFGKVQSLKVSPDDLDLSDRVGNDNETPEKLCPNCDRALPVFAKRCDCGHEFLGAAKQYYEPTGDMVRDLSAPMDAAHFALYCNLLRSQWQKDGDPDSASLEFRHKIGRFPPSDWCRATSIARAPSEMPAIHSWLKQSLKVASNEYKQLSLPF